MSDITKAHLYPEDMICIEDLTFTDTGNYGVQWFVSLPSGRRIAIVSEKPYGDAKHILSVNGAIHYIDTREEVLKKIVHTYNSPEYGPTDMEEYWNKL